jgi:hypothetical protein
MIPLWVEENAVADSRQGRTVTATRHATSVGAGQSQWPGRPAGLEADLAAAVRCFSPLQISKALALIRERRIAEAAGPCDYRAVGSDGKTVYCITRGARCDCAAGSRQLPCYHSAAARLLRVAKRWGLAA